MKTLHFRKILCSNNVEDGMERFLRFKNQLFGLLFSGHEMSTKPFDMGLEKKEQTGILLLGRISKI